MDVLTRRSSSKNLVSMTTLPLLVRQKNHERITLGFAISTETNPECSTHSSAVSKLSVQLTRLQSANLTSFKDTNYFIPQNKQRSHLLHECQLFLYCLKTSQHTLKTNAQFPLYSSAADPKVSLANKGLNSLYVHKKC